MIRNARHASTIEWWITARATINAGWTPAPRHAYPKRATLRSTAPRESRFAALVNSVFAPAIARHA